MFAAHAVSEEIRNLVRALDTETPVHLGQEVIRTIIAAGDLGLVAFVPKDKSPHTVHDPSAFGEDPHIALTKPFGTTFAFLVYEPGRRT